MLIGYIFAGFPRVYVFEVVDCFASIFTVYPVLRDFIVFIVLIFGACACISSFHGFAVSFAFVVFLAGFE